MYGDDAVQNELDEQCCTDSGRESLLRHDPVAKSENGGEHKPRAGDQPDEIIAVLLPVRSVGVMGDDRTYESVVAVRSASSDSKVSRHMGH